jgi:FKBP-type peptidyl-prolyl cis-trans isomerase 2
MLRTLVVLTGKPPPKVSAGKTLHFDVTVRAATPEELEHGHALGPHDHDEDHDH